jgi:hypothetical protein
VETPESIVRAAEERLASAEAQLALTEQGLIDLEGELDALEAEIRGFEGHVHSGVWPSVRVGMAPPLAVLAAGFFFDTGVWPLGLFASIATAVQVLMIPRLNRGPR